MHDHKTTCRGCCEGCGWESLCGVPKVARSDLQIHKATCEYIEATEEDGQIKCASCGVFVFRWDMAKHKKLCRHKCVICGFTSRCGSIKDARTSVRAHVKRHQAKNCSSGGGGLDVDADADDVDGDDADDPERTCAICMDSAHDDEGSLFCATCCQYAACPQCTLQFSERRVKQCPLCRARLRQTAVERVACLRKHVYTPQPLPVNNAVKMYMSFESESVSL